MQHTHAHATPCNRGALTRPSAAPGRAVHVSCAAEGGPRARACGSGAGLRCARRQVVLASAQTPCTATSLRDQRLTRVPRPLGAEGPRGVRVEHGLRAAQDHGCAVAVQVSVRASGVLSSERVAQARVPRVSRRRPKPDFPSSFIPSHISHAGSPATPERAPWRVPLTVHTHQQKFSYVRAHVSW